MTTPTSPNPNSNDPVFIDYLTTGGPRTAAAVIKGESRLLGMTIADGHGRPRRVTSNIAETLRQLGDRPRVYSDSCLALAVEMVNNLPPALGSDDAAILFHLLQQPPPDEFALTKKRTEKGNPRANSLRRVQTLQNTAPELLQQIDAAGLRPVYNEIEKPIVARTVIMTMNGLRVNVERLRQIIADLDTQIVSARQRLREEAGREVNALSPKDLERFLHDERRLPRGPFGRPALSDAALAELGQWDPVACLIRDLRRLLQEHDKASRLLGSVSPNGLIHADLDPLGAETGRFACRKPELQGLPPSLCEVIVADPGHVLLLADIGQCEPRVLAHFSRDPSLLEVFRTDGDVYRQTVAAIHGLHEDQVTQHDRDTIGKEIFIAIIYGKTAYGLAESLDIQVPEAQQILDRFFATRPAVRAWIESVHQQAYANGEVRTISGRRRLLPDMRSSDPQAAAQAQRQAINTIIQGSAADLMKWQLLRLQERLLPSSARLLLTIHDAVLVQAPENEVEEIQRIVVDVMEAPPGSFSVPIQVDVAVGNTWGACKAPEHLQHQQSQLIGC